MTVTDLRLGERNKQCADEREREYMHAHGRAGETEETTGGKETEQASYLCNDKRVKSCCSIVSNAGRILSLWVKNFNA